jgi:hypothetical protein
MQERSQSTKVMIIAAVVVCLVISVFFSLTITRGELNQDEGWYLYGARLIESGQKPYVDFATTQGPVMQYVYSWCWFMVEKWGVMGGRILTAFFGFISILLSALVAWRILQPSKRALGALAVLCLAGLNMYQVFFFSIVKTYALTSLWISASFLLLTFSGKRKHLASFGSGILIMLAVGTRMSAGAMMPAVLLGLFLTAKRNNALKSDLRWLTYGIGAAICMCAMFAPFICEAPEGVKFAMYEYHAGRSAGAGFASLAYKAGFIARVARAYFPALLALLGIVAYGLFRQRTEDSTKRPNTGFSAMLLGGTVLVTALHVAAPFPYDDYQAMLYPIFCAGIVIVGQRLLPEDRQYRAALLLVLAGLMFAGASPINERMFIGKRDRIWWPIRGETSLEKLDRAATFISDRTSPGDELLTQDLYIAVEADMNVPDGMALGPFCFLPEWSREKCEKRHVLNLEMMEEILSSASPVVAAFSEYGLAIKAPDVLPYTERQKLLSLVHQRYDPVERIADFGQAETELTIFVRKQQ